MVIAVLLLLEAVLGLQPESYGEVLRRPRAAVRRFISGALTVVLRLQRVPVACIPHLLLGSIIYPVARLLETTLMISRVSHRTVKEPGPAFPFGFNSVFCGLMGVQPWHQILAED